MQPAIELDVGTLTGEGREQLQGRDPFRMVIVIIMTYGFRVRPFIHETCGPFCEMVDVVVAPFDFRAFQPE